MIERGLSICRANLRSGDMIGERKLGGRTVSVCQELMDRNQFLRYERKENGWILPASLTPLSPCQAILWRTGIHIQTRYYSEGSADAQKSIYNLISVMQPHLSHDTVRGQNNADTRQDTPRRAKMFPRGQGEDPDVTIP